MLKGKNREHCRNGEYTMNNARGGWGIKTCGSICLLSLGVVFLSLFLLNLPVQGEQVSNVRHARAAEILPAPLLPEHPDGSVEVFSNVVMVKKNPVTGKWESVPMHGSAVPN